MTSMSTVLGVKDEVTYGTPTVVDRFFELNSEGVEPEVWRYESTAMRSGLRVGLATKNEPAMLGAAGPVSMDVPTKGFGWWLKHMLGTSATGTVSDSNYTHTGTVGSLFGDMFTMQLHRAFNPSGTMQQFTYHGGKVASWSLGCDIDGVLVADFDLDFEDVDTSTSLAAASYPTDTRVFSWAGGSLTIDGTSKEMRNFSVSCDNGLNTGRRYMRSSPLKKEPVENGERTITWSATIDFTDLTEYNRLISNTRADIFEQIIATFNGPIAHAGATLPQVLITMPAARFDSGPPTASGTDAISLDIGGAVKWNGTDSPITVAYRSPDVTA
jgi:hypothetical protein